MPILIDGYNLLHATGIAGRGRGAGGLEQSRLALLNFLAASIDPASLTHTTVVFDAKAAPPGLPRAVNHHGMTVRYAEKYETADDLIIELIGADHAPRRLVVVSSDHQIQRAARRRKAQAVDSDVWYAEIIQLRRERAESAGDKPARPAVPLLEEDVNYWIRQFGGETAIAEFMAHERAAAEPTSRAKQPENPPDAPNFREKRGKNRPGGNKPTEESRESLKDNAGTLDNPFPPGYGEDLLREL
jgi:predicted RNA-binding protein with PIN domain